ncbi:flagellar M-ring protein FliF [Limnochorda pilosa]|uniref:Flagellar M-ring protein n=1 Tax=Limnochorda pilosa TaxID=1555112 RepID=A0A0K2SKF3_LIMPI|nr:flagellar M-ring protein FliF [Limnochorda pilosa]
MQQPWQNVRERVSHVWQQLGRTGRWAAVAAGALLFILLLYVAFAPGKAPYAPLFSDLRPREAGEIAQVLTEKGIPYELGDAGSTLLVPRDLVYRTRIELAAQGIPSGGTVGFELLNQSSLGMTEYERRVRYVLALQGELARTIQELSPVREARVHIVQPQPSVFVEERRPATASVLLDLRPGEDLSRDQVRGVVNLVASSVEGLAPASVTVVDTRGRTLSDMLQQNPSDALAMNHLELQRAYEKELQTSVQTMLEQVYGYGNAVVRVKTQMDFSSADELNEEFAPVQGGGIRSEQRTEERFEGEGTVAPGGPAGVESNVPGYVGVATGPSSYEKIDTVTNYELSRRQVKRTVPPGRVQGISVAVWVDGTLTPAEQGGIEAAVASAVGADPARGDAVSVQAIRFSRPEAPVVAAAAPLPLSYLVLLGVLLAVLTAAGVWWALRRRAAQPEEAGEGAPGEEELPGLPAEEADRNLRRVRDLALRNPKNFVELLRSWLAEE